MFFVIFMRAGVVIATPCICIWVFVWELILGIGAAFYDAWLEARIESSQFGAVWRAIGENPTPKALQSYMERRFNDDN